MVKIIYSFIGLIILFIGCENITDTNKSYDYFIEQKMDCFCPQSNRWVRLYVRSDTVAMAINIKDNSQLSYEQSRPYKTIKGLFDLISQIDTSAFETVITIDSVNNYPSYIYLSPKEIQQGDTVSIINDAQLSYTTKNYKKTN
jgi:hypothetical protein